MEKKIKQKKETEKRKKLKKERKKERKERKKERNKERKKERQKESDGSKLVLRCPLCALLDIKGGHGGMLEGSQDKRIRKPKLEKGQERKLKRKVLDDIFVLILKIGFFLSG